MVMNSDRLVLTVEEAGQLLGLSRPSAYLAVKRGQIPIIKVGRRILVPKAALEKMLAEAKPLCANQSCKPGE
jgi:excisionase family DNA binding protein